MLANALAMSTALGLPAKVIAGFVDQQVNALLDVDVRKEVAFSALAVGYTKSRPPAPSEIKPLQLPAMAYSKEEVDYPAMRQMHEASSLLDPQKSRHGETVHRKSDSLMRAERSSI